MMGKSMCGHILKNGFNLNLFTRTASKAEDLIKQGAQFLPPEEVASRSDILCLMLGYPNDVESMVLSEQHGILKHMKAGSILIDHTTSSPGLAIRIAEAAK